MSEALVGGSLHARSSAHGLANDVHWPSFITMHISFFTVAFLLWTQAVMKSLSPVSSFPSKWLFPFQGVTTLSLWRWLKCGLGHLVWAGPGSVSSKVSLHIGEMKVISLLLGAEAVLCAWFATLTFFILGILTFISSLAHIGWGDISLPTILTSPNFWT